MAEADAITIPSPSVFLRKSPPPAPPAPSAPPTVSENEYAAALARPTTRRPSAAKAEPQQRKRPAARKPSSGAAVASGSGSGFTAGAGGGDRPKKSKSRNGCVTCKAKRLKCGEEKPGCLQCARRKVECGGYKKDFKWRPFEETNIKVIIERQQQPQQRVSPTRAASAESSKPTSPLKGSSPKLSAHRPTIAATARKDSKRSNTGENGPTTELPQRPAKAKRKERAVSPETSVFPLGSGTGTRLQHSPEGVSLHGLGDNLSPDDLPNLLQQPQTRLIHGLSPTLTEILQPFADENDVPDGDFINFSLPEGMHIPLTTLTLPVIEPALADFESPNGNIEDVLRSPGDAPTVLPIYASSRRQSTSPSLSTRSDEPVPRSWQQGPIGYLCEQPYFSQDSPEMLSWRFDKLTCGILSVMDGPRENPWRNLIWPLAQRSPALYHAVMGMTAFHSSTDVPSLRIIGHEHKQASIRYIQEGIRDNSMTDQTAIATALALGFSESWDQHTATGVTHIKGAQALVKRALEAHKANPLGGVELARLKFLCNAWVYMDVIARLTSVDSDDSNDFDQTFYFDPSSQMVMGGDTDGLPGFGIDFGMPIDARLDPLMGCAGTLFPLLGRVANLVRKVCRSQTNSPAVISQANDLKLALEAWEPPAFVERPDDPTTDVQHTLQTAEAYRWATLLHLHQSVPELPSLTSAELARRVLQYLATVPLASRTVIVTIFPLMSAGCEAKTDEDRQWVRERWAAMAQRMRIGVIDKSATATEEVWRRRDVWEAQPTTRRKLVATADLQPARRRGSPLLCDAHGSANSDPGRTGMVFTYVEGEGDGKAGGSMNEQRGTWGKIPPLGGAYTVRGHLHWLGVFWDWGWEVLLG